MILLDTSLISEAMKPRPDLGVQTWLDAQLAETLYLFSVTIAELLFGISALSAGRRKSALARTLDGLLELFGDLVVGQSGLSSRLAPKNCQFHRVERQRPNPLRFCGHLISASFTAR
jgi:hypothetical protein